MMNTKREQNTRGSSSIVHSEVITKIEPYKSQSGLNWKELFEYRDLFVFWIWRSIKVRYAQSVLGVGWAIIQPLFFMLVFTVIFGNLAKVSSDGAPYAIFSFTALVPWTFFANSITDSTGSLIQNANMISKIYFPRIILPLAAVVAKLVDFVIAMLLLFVLMVWFGIMPTAGILVLPLLILIMGLAAAGVGVWLSALAIQYRDIKYGINFVVQLLMYIAPVVYPASLIPEKYQYIYAINPMVGVIEGFRSALLGTRTMPWDLIAIGGFTAAILFLFSVNYFRAKERLFADVA